VDGGDALSRVRACPRRRTREACDRRGFSRSDLRDPLDPSARRRRKHEVLLAASPNANASLAAPLCSASPGLYAAVALWVRTARKRLNEAMNEVEAKLVARIARGDRRAFADLYARYSSLLLALGMKIVKSRAEAEDVLHDVFLEVWKRAGDYDPQRGSVRAWLALRMRSRSLDKQKSPRVTRAVSFEDSGAEARPAPEMDPGLKMERERVRAALGALSPEQRDVVDLAYFQGLSVTEIGERLSVPVGTVKSRLSAARDRLRGSLEEKPR
jgi:RNA polymerase sigma-70 factor (ECF subfamily)